MDIGEEMTARGKGNAAGVIGLRPDRSGTVMERLWKARQQKWKETTNQPTNGWTDRGDEEGTDGFLDSFWLENSGGA